MCSVKLGNTNNIILTYLILTQIGHCQDPAPATVCLLLTSDLQHYRNIKLQNKAQQLY